jgi:hypothetical protein
MGKTGMAGRRKDEFGYTELLNSVQPLDIGSLEKAPHGFIDKTVVIKDDDVMDRIAYELCLQNKNRTFTNDRREGNDGGLTIGKVAGRFPTRFLQDAVSDGSLRSRAAIPHPSMNPPLLFTKCTT